MITSNEQFKKIVDDRNKYVFIQMGKKLKYFVHDSSYIDNDVSIGNGTKIWHFSHVQSGAKPTPVIACPAESLPV